MLRIFVTNYTVLRRAFLFHVKMRPLSQKYLRKDAILLNRVVIEWRFCYTLF